MFIAPATVDWSQSRIECRKNDTHDAPDTLIPRRFHGEQTLVSWNFKGIIWQDAVRGWKMIAVFQFGVFIRTYYYYSDINGVYTSQIFLTERLSIPSPRHTPPKRSNARNEIGNMMRIIWIFGKFVSYSNKYFNMYIIYPFYLFIYIYKQQLNFSELKFGWKLWAFQSVQRMWMNRSASAV